MRQYGLGDESAGNGSLQHQPLIARFSAFHPFGGRLSSFSALIVNKVCCLVEDYRLSLIQLVTITSHCGILPDLLMHFIVSLGRRLDNSS